MASTHSTSTRLVGLDVFRGWAIVLMIIFHFAYDLAWFRFAHFSVVHDPFWIYFRYVIVSIFLVSVGVSLGIVHRNGIRWDKVARRTLILGAAAIIVTIATRIQSPHAWVYFGILHLIFIASLVGVFFVPFPRTALLVAVLILWGSYSGWLLEMQHQFFLAVRHPLHLPNRTEDLARFFPWMAAVLIGIAVYGLGWYRWFFSLPFLAAPIRFNRFLAFLGRHALIIYLLHLPLLYGLVWVMYVMQR